MHFTNLVEGPLLSIALSMFFAAVILRTALFAVSTLVNRRSQNISRRNPTVIFGWSFLPHHRLLDGEPFYVFSRYLFHLCLFVVPIWLYGHIIIWEESVFEVSWQWLPDIWADWLTLIVLGFVAFFFMRRIFSRRIRLKSSFSDYFLIIVVALPFSTGYFLTHGTLESIPILDHYMMTIHVLGAEAMLVTAAFLFCKIRLGRGECIGCAACELICPTGSLETLDEERIRSITYSHYQCVCCGACVRTCPEDAAELRHEIGVRGLFRLFSRDRIGNIELSACRRCSAPYLPSPQLDKVGTLVADDFIHFCPNCKAAATAEAFYSTDPRCSNSLSTLSEQHLAIGER